MQTTEILEGVRKAACAHGLEIEDLDAAELQRRHRDFVVPDGMQGVFERDGGYLLVEDCIRASVEVAMRTGRVEHRVEPVTGFAPDGDGVTVHTRVGTHAADRLIVASGAWSGGLLATLPLDLQLLEKHLYWYPNFPKSLHASSGHPVYLFERPQGVFYGFPAVDEAGVKLAEHSGGRPLSNPEQIDRGPWAYERARVDAFRAECLPGVGAELGQQVACMYTMTRDGHFIVDRYPAHPQIVFCAGLSGHGFKMAPALGDALADLALSGRTALPIDFLSIDRPGLTV